MQMEQTQTEGIKMQPNAAWKPGGACISGVAFGDSAGGALLDAKNYLFLSLTSRGNGIENCYKLRRYRRDGGGPAYKLNL